MAITFVFGDDHEVTVETNRKMAQDIVSAFHESRIKATIASAGHHGIMVMPGSHIVMQREDGAVSKDISTEDYAKMTRESELYAFYSGTKACILRFNNGRVVVVYGDMDKEEYDINEINTDELTRKTNIDVDRILRI